MTDTDTLARHEAKTEPPKRWKNRWLAIRSYSTGRCSACGAENRVRIEGEEYLNHCTTWPTQEAARRRAEETINRGLKHHCRYLGPIQVPAP